jgi:hypothetical protein
MQRDIVGILSGTRQRRVYGGGGRLDTSELVEELLALGYFADCEERRQVVFTTRRACWSLVRRGLLTAEYVLAVPPVHGGTISWKATEGASTPAT